MLQNNFHIDPIFFLPIDLEDNSNNKEETTNPNINILENFNENPQKHKENIENESTNEDSSFGKELDQLQDEIKIMNTKNNKEKETIVYSKSIK